MAKRVSVDKTLFTVTLLLVFVGLIMVFSASAVMAKERFGSPYSFVGRQFAWAIAGVIAMFVLMRVDYKNYRRPAVVFSLIGITTLLLISVFFLDRSHNTHRWFRLGFLSFQPSELAKPAIIIYLAYFLETRVKQMEDWKNTLLPAVGPSLVVFALIAAQPDLGTAIAIVAITLAILFVAGMNFKYFLYPLAAAPVLFYFLVWRVPWRHQRILAFMDPFSDPLGRGFHIIQSLISVSTGGVTGMGLMEGKQKLFFLPEPHTDFIFAVIGEEFGLLGTLFVVSLFAFFLYRGIRAAVVTRDTFGRYIATGIVAMICIQAFFNISVVLALLPTKGIPLPFISYGGSSLFVMLASVGVLLNITQQAE
jgi:cell division protein FtsW